MKKTLLLSAALVGSMMASTASASEKFINVCGGGPDGTYHKIASDYVDALNKGTALSRLGIEARIPMIEVDGEVGPQFRGSLDNSDAALDGECDVWVTQPDARNWFMSEYPDETENFKVLFTAGTEYVLPFCSKELEIDDLATLDNDPGYKVAVVEGSGDYAFMKNLAVVDSDYRHVELVFPDGDNYLNDSIGTAEMVAAGEAHCSLAITSPESGTVTKIIDQVGESLIFADASDGDFNDLDYYRFEGIDKSKLRGIERADNFGSQDVIAMEREVVINKDMLSKFTPKEKRKVRLAIKNATNTVKAKY